MSPKVIEIARKCREDVLRAGWRDEDLEGACLLASAHLTMTLRKRGIWTRFVAGFYGGRHEGHYYENHCWVTVRGRIVDITATQFDINHPEVFMPTGSLRRSLYVPLKVGLRLFHKDWIVSDFENEFLQRRHGRSPFLPRESRHIVLPAKMSDDQVKSVRLHQDLHQSYFSAEY